MDAQQTSQNTEEKYCVGRESNPDQLLGRQLCWPLYHRRCADPSASQRSSENQLARILGSLCHEHQCRISWANGQLTNLCVHVLLFINECYLLQWWRSPLRKGLYSSVAERWSCKPKVMSSILIGGMLFLTQVILSVCEKRFWPRRDSNTQPSDLESDALPLRHGVKMCEVLPRFELGSLDSKSRVLTITPWDRAL